MFLLSEVKEKEKGVTCRYIWMTHFINRQRNIFKEVVY